MNLIFKTRENSNPKGKPKVYFCCHKDDFEKYFERISNEVLSLQNCSVWYRDFSEAVNDELLSDLKQMQLFVMPVTTNLLCTENDALDIEFRFAIENHIPVLPLMQEPGLEQLFNQKCGDLQFLDKNNTDITAISYNEKLKNYLESVLIGDELAEKIRAAFDAYVFLSYRKKDRKYAQELMRLIHKNEFCRDIAIWYDEFLTPGENFNESIKEALQKSGLFVLAVTPSLLEKVVDDNGEEKDNYIITTEYPMARKEGKPVLPAELVPTDREELSQKYEDIPTVANAHNDSELSNALLESIKKMAIKKNDKNPEHNFFIGLAYLGGVDVEVDHERAIALITSAAEAGLPEAMEKIVSMYRNGEGVKKDNNVAIIWQKRYCNLLYQKYQVNKNNQECLVYLKEELRLAKYQLDVVNFKDSRNTCWRVIKYCRENGGYGDFINNNRIVIYIESYNILGNMFYERGDLGQARECYEKSIRVYYDWIEKIEISPYIYDIIVSCCYQLSKLFSKAPFDDEKNKLNYLQKAVQFSIESQKTFSNSIDNCNLGICYINLGELYAKDNFIKAIDIYDKAYNIFESALKTNIYGDICHYMYRLSICYGDAYIYGADYINAMNYYDKAIDLCQDFLYRTNDLEMNYNFCIGCLKIMELNSISGVKSKHNNIEKDVLCVVEWLAAKFSNIKYQELLADVYFSYKKDMSEYGIKAFEIYRNLFQKQPETYNSKFWRCKKELWDKGIIDGTHFPFVKLIAGYDDKGEIYFTDFSKNNSYKFNIEFIGEKYSDNSVSEIMICKYVIQDMQDKYSHTYKVENAYKTLQLCKPESIGTRNNPTPDEFVYVFFHGQVDKNIKFQRCYG